MGIIRVVINALEDPGIVVDITSGSEESRNSDSRILPGFVLIRKWRLRAEGPHQSQLQ